MKHAIAIFLCMCSLAVGSEIMRPTERVADTKPKIDLEAQVPESFGGWRQDPTMMPLVPAPDVQERLNALYSQTLARSYINANGDRVMLSIAYGSDQSSDATQAHRPEFCYSAQGFLVSRAGESQLAVTPATQIPLQRLIAVAGQRNEPISYWITIDEEIAKPGIQRKLRQIEFGLGGKIPDGMLVRVSTIDPDVSRAFATQEEFLKSLYAAIPPSFKNRYFGRENK